MDEDIETVPVNDPAIHVATEKFDFDNPPIDPVELVMRLAKVMVENNGIGLSANQLGLPYRVFVMKSNPIIACFNPIVLDTGLQTHIMEEGCLSYPGLYVTVRRPLIIKVRFTEANLNVRTERFDGMTARVFLHELAHLDGRTMMDDASIVQREKATTQWKQLQRRAN